MKVLIFWDIYGRLWRKAFIKEFGKLKKIHSPDLTIANIENITSWRGPASVHAEMIDDLWVDVMTGGDHIYDNMPDISKYFSKEDCKLIRPANFIDSKAYPLFWEWYKIVISSTGERLLVVQLLWEVFMSHKVENPFHKIDIILESVDSSSYDICVVEFHRETTAELYGMAHYLNGRVALVYWTHTHIQTNDAHILSAWTWIIADIGMNWPFESIIWADFNSVKKRFLTWISRWKIEQQLQGKYIINALSVTLNTKSGLCEDIKNISFTWEL